MDPVANVVTIILGSVVVPVLIGCFIYNIEKSPADALVLISFVLAVAAYCIYFRPLSYIVTSDNLVIHRLAGDICVPVRNIRKIVRLTSEDTKLARGTYGFSMIGGYFGKYNDPVSGRLSFYATHRYRHVLLETNSEKIVISPDEPENFIRHVLSMKREIQHD